MTTAPYEPSKPRIFFSIILSGMLVATFLFMGRNRSGDVDPVLSMIVHGGTMGGYIVSAFICTFVKSWKWPLFVRIVLTHVTFVCLISCANATYKGLAYALGTSVPISIMIASLAWLMAGRDSIFNRIIFWGAAALISACLVIGTIMIFLY
jgi:hypothetical protein